MLQPIDIALIAAYLGFLVIAGVRSRYHAQEEEEYLLSGRRLSLPALVATLVSTWYGSILAVGEFTYEQGLSQWFVFGLPYYVFALVYALFLVKPIRNLNVVSIPELIGKRYGGASGKISALLVFLLVNPAPYILMIGFLIGFISGVGEMEFWFSIAAALFSVIYIQFGGFRSVVRTDVFQFILMFAGFAFIVAFAFSEVSPIQVWQSLPEQHRYFKGNLSWPEFFVWFFLAMWTFVDPGFFQRVNAARSVSAARRGLLISLGFWFVFDMMTLSAGLYAYHMLPDLTSPALSFPLLAAKLLPAGFLGLFLLALLATIMSTNDSLLFLAGQTLGRDFWLGTKKHYRTRDVKYGIWFSALISIVLIGLIPDVIELIFSIGSLVVPSLLLLVLSAFSNAEWTRGIRASRLLITPFVVAVCWMIGDRVFELRLLGDIPAFYPAIISGVLLLMFDGLRSPSARLPGG